ncbi:unnamed protein product [Phytomonas sp. EM1]|nr:unnamed protein product [Phytomonas sp. EM1]|eukprot:CCW60075.1 unnamed protein product [Phytomonas sp. isolate EM1]
MTEQSYNPFSGFGRPVRRHSTAADMRNGGGPNVKAIEPIDWATKSIVAAKWNVVDVDAIQRAAAAKSKSYPCDARHGGGRHGGGRRVNRGGGHRVARDAWDFHLRGKRRLPRAHNRVRPARARERPCVPPHETRRPGLPSTDAGAGAVLAGPPRRAGPRRRREDGIGEDARVCGPGARPHRTSGAVAARGRADVRRPRPDP